MGERGRVLVSDHNFLSKNYHYLFLLPFDPEAYHFLADFKEINSKPSELTMILVGKGRERGWMRGMKTTLTFSVMKERRIHIRSSKRFILTHLSGLLMFQCGRVPLPLAACPRLRGEVDGRAGEEDGGRSTRGRPQPHQQTQENIL